MLKDTLTYEPTELAFGTSGLRGLIADMTDLECYINMRGFLSYLELTDGTVYIAGDLRGSTPRIMAAVAQAVVDAGLEYVNCGLIPTPAVAFFAAQEQSACVMVTGSHIPDDRNGIKFYKPEGEVLKSDEAGIREHVATVRAELYASDTDAFDSEGALTEPHQLQDEDDEAQTRYIDRYVDFFGETALEDTHLVMYQHSAVGRDLIPEILEAMGAEVTRVDRSDVFVPIDTENVTPDNEAHFKQIASDNPGCAAIISTDGDSDRPFVIDETGAFHRGDVLGLVVSRFLEADAAAFPVSSNDALVRALEADKTEYVKTRIGSPYVITAMEDLSDGHTNVVGWEVNGGFLTGSEIQRGDAMLAPLPTRDALLPMLCAVLAAKERGVPVSELFAELPKRYTQAGLIDNFPNEVSANVVATLAKEDDAAEALIESTFTKDSGFDEVLEIDTTDGIRIVFANHDVAHLRPSGNAPQLRIYSNANTQERADQIVALGIAEPDGILRTIEAKLQE